MRRVCSQYSYSNPSLVHFFPITRSAAIPFKLDYCRYPCTHICAACANFYGQCPFIAESMADVEIFIYTRIRAREGENSIWQTLHIPTAIAHAFGNKEQLILPSLTAYLEAASAFLPTALLLRCLFLEAVFQIQKSWPISRVIEDFHVRRYFSSWDANSFNGRPIRHSVLGEPCTFPKRRRRYLPP